MIALGQGISKLVLFVFLSRICISQIISLQQFGIYLYVVHFFFLDIIMSRIKIRTFTKTDLIFEFIIRVLIREF